MPEGHNFDILGIGAPVVDHIIRVDEEFIHRLGGGKGGMIAIDYPTLEKILEEVGGEATLIAGGSAANTIKGLSHYGNKCAFMGKLGKDSTGVVFTDSMKSLGITLFSSFAMLPTAHSLCFVTPDGDRTMRTYLGASEEMSHHDLNERNFSGVKLVHIEGYNLLRDSLVERAMHYAKKAGALVSFDLASYEIVNTYRDRILHLIETYVDIAISNADEAKALTGLPPQDSCMMIQNLAKISTVLVGEEGCLVGSENNIIQCPAYRVKAIDSTGAGDLFSSGFLHGYLQGWPLNECAELGNRTGSAVVQILGAEVPPVTWKKILSSIQC